MLCDHEFYLFQCCEVYCVIFILAVVKATIDGGTNELYDNTEKQRDSYIPDIITGDFDSARPEVLHYYKEKVSDDKQVKTKFQVS